MISLVKHKRTKMQHLEAQKEQIIEDFIKGVTIKKLAERYHCSHNTMVKHLKEWGVKK